MGRQDGLRAERIGRLADRAGRAVNAMMRRLRAARSKEEGRAMQVRYHVLNARWNRLIRAQYCGCP